MSLSVSHAFAAVVGSIVTAKARRSISPAPNPTSEDVIVRSFGQAVTVQVGQTLRVLRPADFSKWRVDYSPYVSQGLISPDAMRSPGPDGWRFRLTAAGETNLTFTPLRTADPRHPDAAAGAAAIHVDDSCELTSSERV
jgi:hypothetical protein